MKVTLISTVKDCAGVRRPVPRLARGADARARRGDRRRRRLDRRHGRGVRSRRRRERARGTRREHLARSQRRARGGHPRRDRGDRRGLRARPPVARGDRRADRGRRRRLDGLVRAGARDVVRALHGRGEPPARCGRGRPVDVQPLGTVGGVPSRGDRRGRRLPRVARDRRGHVGRPAVAGAGHGHAVRSRRGRAVAAPRRARRHLAPVLPVRARRCAGRHASRAPRPAVRRLRGARRGAHVGTHLAEGARGWQAPSRTHGRRCAADGRERATPANVRSPRSPCPP